MHTVGSRALQSVAAAPKPYRPRIARQRPAFGGVRGFLSSPARPARPAQPDEPSAAHGGDGRPDSLSGAGVGAADSDNGSVSEPAAPLGAPSSSSSEDSAVPPSSSATTTASSSGPPAPEPPSAPSHPLPQPPAAAEATSPAELFKEAFASSAGRGRASRGRIQDGMPAVTLPNWFLQGHVRLLDPGWRAPATATALRSDLVTASSLMFARALPEGGALSPVPAAATATATATETDVVDMAAVTEQDRETLSRYLGAWLDGAGWDARKVAQAAALMRRGGQLEAITRRGAAVAAAASYLVAALAYDGRSGVSAEGAPVPLLGSTGTLEQLDPGKALDMPRLPFGKACQDAVKQSLETGTVQSLAREADDAVAWGIAIRADPGERLVFRELCSTVATELRAVSPARAVKDPKRLVSVLTILNYKGRSKAAALMEDVARALSAHVVHLDARSIADIAGPYLGQTAYWSRGNIAMLGYAAAQKNGQAASRYPADSDDESEMSVTLSRLPVALMKSGLGARMTMKGFASSESDDRWDDLKINNVLEAMVRAADAAPAPPSPPSPSSPRLTPTSTEARPVILHLHHFLELSSLSEGAQVLNKLRGIVDRMWQKGRKIVLVGSTSTNMSAFPSLLDKVEELRQDDCHIIPYRVAEGPATRALEEQDTFGENMGNIRTMIAALTSEPQLQDGLPWEAARGSGAGDDDGVPAELRAALSSTIYDIHWVYRFATLVLGSSLHPAAAAPASPPALDAHAFLQALRLMRDQDQMWKETAGAQEPYFSPLTVDQASEGGGGDAESAPEIRVGGVRKKVQPGDYSEYEKKFLTDLIDANDIKTTFADIVCPDAVKDSLKALTSLSLVRPEAFLYGVLAAERIPGCLLYGPPGTGKTLLAKAVAKQSGANMLEISAASINDMWVGNSEKNVQALFSLARKLSPVVIFLDEADALLGARQTRPGRGGHRETINQFLREWDGLTSNMKAFIMVATNRPFDLDEAVLRRLPRRILVDLPLRDSRLAILHVMLRDEALDAASVSLETLAAETELYSGSDLKNLCVAAAMEAVREEVRAQEAHTGPEPFVFPARRVLAGRHFARALQEIGASISEDMSSLQAIRRFDERYGDNSSKRRRKRRNMGFEVVPGPVQTEDARVRQPA